MKSEDVDAIGSRKEKVGNTYNVLGGKLEGNRPLG
jgi:hypothetical protein